MKAGNCSTHSSFLKEGEAFSAKFKWLVRKGVLLFRRFRPELPDSHVLLVLLPCEFPEFIQAVSSGSIDLHAARNADRYPGEGCGVGDTEPLGSVVGKLRLMKVDVIRRRK